MENKLKVVKRVLFFVVGIIVLLVGYVMADESYQEWKYRMNETSPKILELFNLVKIGANFEKELIVNGPVKSAFENANFEYVGSTPSGTWGDNPGKLIPRLKDGKEAVDRSKTSYVAFYPYIRETGTPITRAVEDSAYIVVVSDSDNYSGDSVIKKVFLVAGNNVVAQSRN